MSDRVVAEIMIFPIKRWGADGTDGDGKAGRRGMKE